MPPFVVLPCTMDDGPALARNCVPAFWEDPDWAHIWTNVGKTCEYVTSQSELRWSHNLLLDPDRRRNLKAVDEETGEVVGYVRYIMPLGTSPDLWPEAKVPAVSPERAAEAKKNYDGADWKFDDLGGDLDSNFAPIRNRLMEGKTYIILEYLAVHPSRKGQGIASLLVQHGAKVADKLGFGTFVLAFRAGVGVYKRAGFKLQEELIQDNSKFGGTSEYGAFFMIREVGEN